jgi:hypothetical protein
MCGAGAPPVVFDFDFLPPLRALFFLSFLPSACALGCNLSLLWSCSVLRLSCHGLGFHTYRRLWFCGIDTGVPALRTVRRVGQPYRGCCLRDRREVAVGHISSGTLQLRAEWSGVAWLIELGIVGGPRLHGPTFAQADFSVKVGCHIEKLKLWKSLEYRIRKRSNCPPGFVQRDDECNGDATSIERRTTPASQFVSLFCQEKSVVFQVIQSLGGLLSTNDQQASTIPQIPVGSSRSRGTSSRRSA